MTPTEQLSRIISIGNPFEAAVDNPVLGAGASLLIQMVTPAASVGKIILADIALLTDAVAASFELREAPTVTDGTSALTSYCRNRNVSVTSILTNLWSDPSAISGGTLLKDISLGSGIAKVHGLTGLPGIHIQRFWELKVSTDYTFVFTNDDASAKIAHMILSWFEEKA